MALARESYLHDREKQYQSRLQQLSMVKKSRFLERTMANNEKRWRVREQMQVKEERRAKEESWQRKARKIEEMVEQKRAGGGEQ